jgi:protein TonB
MKRTLLTLIFLLFILGIKAQSNDTTKNKNEKDNNNIFTSVEHNPEFPGGVAEFYKYLTKTIRYPPIARENDIQGRVIISMVVEKDGSLSHIKIERGVCADIDKEAVRVMALCPNWNPGTQNGRIVRVFYSIPISFTLSK